MDDVDAAGLVARFEMAILNSARAQDAYRSLGLSGEREAQAAAFKASEEAQRTRDGYRLALLEALTGDRTGQEDPNNVWKGAETPFAENH